MLRVLCDLQGPSLPKVLPLPVPPPSATGTKWIHFVPLATLSLPQGQSEFTSSRQGREGEGRRSFPPPFPSLALCTGKVRNQQQYERCVRHTSSTSYSYCSVLCLGRVVWALVLCNSWLGPAQSMQSHQPGIQVGLSVDGIRLPTLCEPLSCVIHGWDRLNLCSHISPESR